MRKTLYCFVDETGQDTMGKWFLVLVAIALEKEILEKSLLKIEHTGGKHSTKWRKAKHKQRVKYFEGIFTIIELKHSLFYSVYKDTKLYSDLIALTTAKAILDKSKGEYNALITVDGLSRSLENQLAASLRKLGIRTGKVKGGRDESSPFLRLADTVAGLLRDAFEGKDWAAKLVIKLRKLDFIKKI